MANDITLVIGVEKTGITEAIKETKSLERQVKAVAGAFNEGSISEKAYRNGIRQLIQSHSDLFKSTQKASYEIHTLAKGYQASKQALDDSKEHSEWVKRQQYRMSLMKNSEKMEAKAAADAKKVADVQVAAAQREADALETLRLKYDRTYRIQKQYEAGKDQIAQAYKAEILSADQLQVELRKLATEYEKVKKGQSSWSNQFVTGSDSVGRMANRTGMAVQQMGYQVGDFFVQVQGGTNVLVAFGQQATQLVGVLPSVAHWFNLTQAAAIGLSASLGIIIPIATAIGATWMRYSEASDEAAKKTKTLDDELKSLDDSIKSWLQTKDALSRGITVEELIGGEGIAAATKQVEEAQENLNKTIERNRSAISLLFGSAFVAARQEINSNEEVKAATDNLAAAKERLANIQARMREEQKATYDQEARNLTQQIEKQTLINKFGEDNWRVRQLERQQAIANYNDQIDKQVKANELGWIQGEILKQDNELLARKSTSLDDVLTRLGQSTGLINSSTTATGAWESAMSGVRAEISAIISGLSSIGGGMIGNAAKQAEIDALKAGKSIRDAAVAQQSYIKEQEWAQREIGASWWEKQQIASEKFLYQESLRLDTTLEKERALAREREKTSPSSGGGGAGTPALTLDKRETSLQSLLTQYMPTETEWEKLEQEREKLEVWQQKANQALESAQIKEREGLEAHNQYKLEIAKRYVDAKSRIDKQEQDLNLSSYESFFGSMATVFAQGNEKALKVSKAFGVAEATVSMWRGAAKALELPYPANLAAWGKVLATGASAIASIKSVTASSSGSSSSASTSSSAAATSTSSSVASTATAATPQAPQMIQLSGLTANSLFSGSQLQELFDAIYEENKDRGYVLSVG